MNFIIETIEKNSLIEKITFLTQHITKIYKTNTKTLLILVILFYNFKHMKNIFLISEKTLNQIEDKSNFFEKALVILFKETYKTNFTNQKVKEVITSAQIAQDFLKATNKKIWTNNTEKAKEITENFDKENFDIFLVYADKILNETKLENKIALIIEKNNQINDIDCAKIVLLPPSPIIVEKILSKHPESKIKTINEKDEGLFQLNYYYQNINKLS